MPRSTPTEKPAATTPTPDTRKKSVAKTSAPKRVRAKAATPVTVPSYELVAARAYEKFVARGHRHGHDVADWLAAEAELHSPAA